MRRSMMPGLTMILAGIAGLLAAAQPAAEPAEPSCQARLHEFEPRTASAENFSGRAAVLFYEALLHRNQPVADAPFDTVVIRSGPDVLGGMVALIARGDCVLTYGFVSAIDYLDATGIVKLYAAEATLAPEAHLDLARLRALGDAGHAIAQFHVGLTLALGWGTDRDRGAGIAMLRRSAENGYPPAMLALGLALSGRGSLEDEVKRPGQPPDADEFTDRVQSCVWLQTASASADPFVRSAARQQWQHLGLKSVMTRAERSECRRRLRALSPR